MASPSREPRRSWPTSSGSSTTSEAVPCRSGTPRARGGPLARTTTGRRRTRASRGCCGNALTGFPAGTTSPPRVASTVPRATPPSRSTTRSSPRDWPSWRRSQGSLAVPSSARSRPGSQTSLRWSSAPRALTTATCSPCSPTSWTWLLQFGSLRLQGQRVSTSTVQQRPYQERTEPSRSQQPRPCDGSQSQRMGRSP